jgi:succinate dehydrogenase/fumarate reductase flavoprotein subunit
MAEKRGKPGIPSSWDEEFDVVVVGYGYAGGVSAIEAHDGRAEVLLIEKMLDPGGISICSGGSLRVTRDVEKGFAYLKATNAGTSPDDVLRALAEGMREIPDYIARLAEVNDARPLVRPTRGNYPFPGFETFEGITIDEIPGFDPAAQYPYVSKYLRADGTRLFKVVEDNVARRGIPVRLSTPALRLITDAEGEVCGLVANPPSGPVAIKARRAVILACGGFEADEEMKRRHWQEKPVFSAAFLGNTGDGIRMAADVGADLWHMWHYHGSYGFRHPDPAFPFAIRLKKLPDWTPTQAVREDVKMSWIVLDRDGRRYMNEYAPYVQDTGHRPMELYDPVRQTYPRIPSYLIFDEEGRQFYSLGSVVYNDRRVSFKWSEDNLKEVELGILGRADSVAEMAERLHLDASVLRAGLDRWNESCERGVDEDYGRPPTSMVEIKTPPFYFGEVWPVVSNTHGGPVHNARQQILDAFGDPIPRLYAAGELGSVFGHLYLSGGNLAECFVSGQIAGRGAASLSPWG